MSCHRWEEDLALWVGDDLEAERIPALEDHLASCAECREVHRMLLESREVLRDPSGLEELLAQEGKSLRDGVMAQVATERRRAAAAPWLLLAAALLLAWGAFLLWPSTEPPVENLVAERVVVEPTPSLRAFRDAAPSHLELSLAEPPTATGSLAEAETTLPPPVAPRQVGPRQAEPRQVGPRQAEPRQAGPRQAVASIPQPPASDALQAEPEPVVVQILTENPDLVIYWLVDSPAAKEQGHDISTL